MKQTFLHLFLIVLVSATVFFTNLGTARLWDRDEPRNAGAALEMMERGDWVVPIFNDQLRHQKPVLIYWLMISSYALFGVSEFSARFWSAALAIGTVLATYAIGRRLLNPRSALLSALALSTCFMFAVAGRAATPDSLLIFCSTMALMFYVLGTFAPHSSSAESIAGNLNRSFPESWRYLLPMYAMMGLGTLAKGPVAVVLPCAIIGMFMLIQRLPSVDAAAWNRHGWLSRVTLSLLRPFHPLHFLKTVWKMRPLTAIIVILAIAAPWYIMVGIRTEGDWLNQFFLKEHFGRTTTALEGHSGGWWYYPLAILVGFFPWSVMIGPTLVHADRELSSRGEYSKATAFLLCWVGVQVGIFTIAQTKLPSYVTPCYPALGLLTGLLMSRLIDGHAALPERLCRYGFICLAGCGLLLSGGLGLAAHQYLDGQWWIALVGLAPLVGGLVAWWLMIQERQFQAIVTFAMAAFLLIAGTFGFVTVAVDQHQQSHLILDRIRDRDRAAPVATFRCLESSWVFYGRHSIYELSSEPTDEVWTDQRKNDWLAKDWPSPEQFAAANADALFITTDHDLDELLSRLPTGYGVLERAPYFLRDKSLILVGSTVTQTAAEPDHVEWK